MFFSHQRFVKTHADENSFLYPFGLVLYKQFFYAQLPWKFVVTFLRPFPHQFPYRLLITVPSLIYISFPLEF